eukprot:4033622-Pyramimonas_sp.AAC.1
MAETMENTKAKKHDIGAPVGGERQFPRRESPLNEMDGDEGEEEAVEKTMGLEDDEDDDGRHEGDERSDEKERCRYPGGEG